MESKKFRDIMGAYSSIYEKKEDPEMEKGEEKEEEGEEEKKGKKKDKEEKSEKEDKEDEKEMKEGADLFDYLLEYLVAEGYADTNKAALAIMANMSEEWKQDIVEGMTMKDFKANRKKLQRKEDSDDAKKRGHVDKFTGKPYGTAEAASRRKNLNPAERESRRKFAEDPN
jgi:hypothetical protein